MQTIQRVIKRDGSAEPFYPFKIEDAIRKAFQSVHAVPDEKVIETILNRVLLEHIFEVEAIQDLIERSLFDAHYFFDT